MKNTILSCSEAETDTQFDGRSYYEHDKGQLIFALVKAGDETEAKSIAGDIIMNITRR